MGEELRGHYELIFGAYLDVLERLVRAKAAYLASGGRAAEVLAAYDEYIVGIVEGAQQLRAILEQEPFDN